MSDYTNTFGGAAHDTAEDTIQGVDFDTQFDAVATMSASKANKKPPATTSNLATLSATGDLTDSLETVATMKSFSKRGAIYLDCAATTSTVDFNSGGTITRATGTVDLSVFKKGDVVTIHGGATLNLSTEFTLTADATTTSMSVTPNPTAESGQAAIFTTEGVVEVLDEDDMATDSASSVPSQQSAKAYSDSKISTDPSGTGTLSTGGTMEVFVSTAYNYTAAGMSLATKAHGLSGVPQEIHIMGKCLDNSVDTWATVNAWYKISDYENVSGSVYGVDVAADATNVWGEVANSGVLLVAGGGGDGLNANATPDWAFYIIAKYYA